MNFYPVPPIIRAELYVRIPDDMRCLGKDTEWRGGFARQFQHIFLEGPVVDNLGNLYIVDVPYGRILRVDPAKTITVVATWDGEPNGLAATHDGHLVIADYKQVRRIHCADSQHLSLTKLIVFRESSPSIHPIRRSNH